ncbi:HD domain-containing phosphohydrolase [Vibrio sp. CAU 1672]|uniref:HD-GYP domain-containing protein n=1 Tax=Vibrio sp. CAU 1672 TaxID=3032594 RepID=UPI0023DBDB06|nr:HD domain-containing phosphohydrolase [Vibrio sp. CAU 1672]MDF2154643.1 c-di-GMP phosphodiesterase [Vibrio sp. CAU 1672]
MAHRSFYPFAKPLNEQMQTLKCRMQAHLPIVDRISYAKYIPQQGLLTSFAESIGDNGCLPHYEAPLSKLPRLKAAAQSATPHIIDNLKVVAHSPRVRSLLQRGYCSSAAIPCYESHDFTGFIFLNSVQPNAFTLAQLNPLKPYFDMVQYAIESELNVVQAIEFLAGRIQCHLPGYTPQVYSHTRRITLYARLIAKELAQRYQFSDEVVEQIGLFAQYHALSDISLHPDIVCRRKGLNNEQEAILKSHMDECVEAADGIIERIGNPVHPSVILFNQIIAYQYENLDGSGYPYGVQQDLIPVPARIVAVANVFDVMTTHHPDREASSITSALLDLEKLVYQGALSLECVDALRGHQAYLKEVLNKYPEYSLGFGAR